MPSRLEEICVEKGLRMTGQRRVIARVLSESQDHPDVELVYKRAVDIDETISISTVYRTVRMFEENGILERHDFGDGRARYEEVSDQHHDHLINVQTGQVIEFTSNKIEELQKLIAAELGFELIDHRLELYGKPLSQKSEESVSPEESVVNMQQTSLNKKTD
jgi:Fur family transcriptional regulator, ferric uptake regulator